MQVDNNVALRQANAAFTESHLKPYDYSARDASNNYAANRRKEALRWSKIWFEHLCRFHRKPIDPQWRFSLEQVIAFLKSRVEKGDPAKRRLWMVEGLILFQADRPVADRVDLSFVARKLKERSALEAAGGASYGPGNQEPPEVYGSPEEVVGRIDPKELPLIQELRRRLRLAGRKRNTELAYVKWTKRFLKSRGVSTREQCLAVDRKDVEAFLTDLVVDGNVAASTQNQAFYGIQFFFHSVLEKQIGDVDALRSNKPKLRPTVMSTNEVRRVLDRMAGRYAVIAQLMYGSGMRISEVLRLRVKDFDFDQRLISVVCSKGDKSRLVPLPENLIQDLQALIVQRRELHDQDVAEGKASVWLPYALERKNPRASGEFRWQFLFASYRHSKDGRTGKRHRHHLHRDSFGSALRKAANAADLLKYITSHTFRHSFATHLLQAGTDVRTVQELLGHAELSTTMIYTHVLFDPNKPVTSPLDLLGGKEGRGGVGARGVF